MNIEDVTLVAAAQGLVDLNPKLETAGGNVDGGRFQGQLRIVNEELPVLFTNHLTLMEAEVMILRVIRLKAGP